MTRKDDLAKRNLYDELIELRDRQRARARAAIRVIKGSELPVEVNRQGRTRWYLYPTLDDTAIQTLIFQVIEIAGGSRTGRQRVQGGQVLYVWKGRGYTIVDGSQHHWEAGDVINLPLLTEGVVVQHFNSDTTEIARLLQAEPNYAPILGVDMGSGFEQLEDAPVSEQRDE